MSDRRDDEKRHRTLLAAQLIVSVIATAALIVAIIGLGTLNKSRVDSARDSCRLFKGLVAAATPPDRRRQAALFVKRTPLRDCEAYAREIIK